MMAGVGMAFGASIPLETLIMVFGTRKRAEREQWSIDTAARDRKIAAELGGGYGI